MRIAVLGCGSIGSRHAHNLAAAGGHDLVLYDADADVCRRLAAELEIEASPTLDAVWRREPSVVFVATPPDSHLSLALEGVRRGCDLFVEKPLAHRIDGIAALRDEVERGQRVAMVACNMRFHPGPARLERLLRENAVGEVLSARLQSGSFLPRWRPHQDYRRSYSASPVAGGALLDCIHEIDLALWLFGSARLVASATRKAGSLGLETDGLAELLLRHESGTISSVHLNFVQRDYRRLCQVVGSSGTLYWDFEDGQVRLRGEDGREQARFAQPEGWQPNDMYVEELRHFLRCVEERREPGNTLGGGEASLRLALEARG